MVNAGNEAYETTLMNCTKVKDQLAAYLAGELNAVARKRVDEHLLGCISCREELARERAFDDFVREAGIAFDEPVPPGFLKRVVNLAEAESAPAVVSGRAAGSALLWQWLMTFTLPVRVAIIAGIILATFGGIQSGRIVTGLVTNSSSTGQPDPMAVLEMMPVEQEMMQLMHGAKIGALDQTAPKPGDR
jgi:anti-sigma factor RsiW